MALLRILVDGYSLLHNWPELAPGRARHSAAARDELIRVLTLYQDAIGTPITVVFDGTGGRRRDALPTEPVAIEVLYSRQGQTADDMIERAVHRFQPYGEVLAVSDDRAERETVSNLGGLTASCRIFIGDVRNALSELADDIKLHNRHERRLFGARRE